MSEASVGLDITAPPQRVWDVVTDITLLPRWRTELLSVEWAEGFHGPALGARFVGRNRHAAVGEWTTLSVTMLIEREPHRREIVDNRLAESGRRCRRRWRASAHWSKAADAQKDRC